jgi:SnoaL-like domain
LYKCLLVGSTGRVGTRGGGMSTDVREIVTEYVRAVGNRRFDRFEELLHPEVEFGGTTVAELRGASVVAEGYRRLGPIVLRNDIKELVVEGDRAAVLYDFVTDTEAKAVLTAEFLTIEDGSIRSITLLFDWRAWPTVLEELQRRTPPG